MTIILAILRNKGRAINELLPFAKHFVCYNDSRHVLFLFFVFKICAFLILDKLISSTVASQSAIVSVTVLSSTARLVDVAIYCTFIEKNTKDFFLR